MAEEKKMTWTWLGIATAALFLLACAAGFHHGFVKEIVSTFFVILTIVIVWAVNPHVNHFLRENTPVYEMILDSCREAVGKQTGNAVGLGQEEQAEVLDKLELPAILKNGILENNTAEVYKYLSVDTYVDYVADYLAVIAVNGLSFLVSFLLVTVFVRVAVYVLNILTMLPVVHGVNKLAGAMVGGVKFIIFVWVAMLLITVLCNTELGRKGMELIEGDFVLSFLYEHNIFMKVFMSIFYGN